MSTLHLLRFDGPPAAIAPLAAALRAIGLRFGWLALAAPAPLPAALSEAAALGALRAVAVGGGRSAAVKPLAGAPVLRDLLREHFRGCALVLLTGEAAGELTGQEAAGSPPRLSPAAGGRWRVSAAGGEAVYEAAELAARLRRPRPWSPE